jgi:hypothetical protein
VGKDHIPRKGKEDISEEGQDLSYWKTKTYGGTKHPYSGGVIHESRKRGRINEDGSFMYQKTKEEHWVNSHTFPTNVWIHKLTKRRNQIGAISRPHRHPPPMLVTDPWRTDPVGSSNMEILMNLGRECLQTIWNEIPSQIEGYDLQYLNLTQDTIWNTVRVRGMDPPSHRQKREEFKKTNQRKK